jgi:alpha-L-rhamnosidase
VCKKAGKGKKEILNNIVGDLRVMALTNNATFKNYNLVKRCLYLFASFPLPNGYLPPCVYEKPYPHSYETLILDYAAVYIVVLYEYVTITGDVQVAKDLWAVAQIQIDLLAKNINDTGVS